MRLCPACKRQVQENTSYCTQCGYKLTESGLSSTQVVERGPNYAGFGIRLAADLIDSLIMAAVFLLLLPLLPVVNILISIVVGSVYGAAMESSERQASLGKLAFGLRVTDLEQRRISFGRAFIRWGTKTVLQASLVGWLTFLTIVFAARKRGVHDLIVGTVVRRV